MRTGRERDASGNQSGSVRRERFYMLAREDEPRHSNLRVLRAALSSRIANSPHAQSHLACHTACRFESIASSISPTVRNLVGLPIDVIVRRQDAAPATTSSCLRLRLTPERWSGQGLLGCILK